MGPSARASASATSRAASRAPWTTATCSARRSSGSATSTATTSRTWPPRPRSTTTGAPTSARSGFCFCAATGRSDEHQKISATAGGFAGVLEDGDAFGSSLVAPGDLDGDGTSDLIVGAGRDDDGGTDRGAGYILFLRLDGTVRAHQKLSDLEGGNVGLFEDGDQWTPLARVGDLDGDRRADLLVGSRLSSAGGFQRGAARVLFTGFAVDRETTPGPRGSLRLSPNPATSRTSVVFDLEVAGRVRLRVFDVLGREMATVLEGDRPSGAHRVEVDVSGWAPGTYVVRLEGEEVSTVRLVVAR